MVAPERLHRPLPADNTSSLKVACLLWRPPRLNKQLGFEYNFVTNSKRFFVFSQESDEICVRASCWVRMSFHFKSLKSLAIYCTTSLASASWFCVHTPRLMVNDADGHPAARDDRPGPSVRQSRRGYAQQVRILEHREQDSLVSYGTFATTVTYARSFPQKMSRIHVPECTSCTTEQAI